MGSGGKVDIAQSTGPPPLHPHLTGPHQHPLIRGLTSPTSRSFLPGLVLPSSPSLIISRWWLPRCIHFTEMRTKLLSVLISCLLLILIYCCVSTGTPLMPDYSLYYVEHPHRTGDINTTMEQRFPQAIIIGVRKGGTRALLEFLDLHPQLQTADDEMHFFDRPEQYERGLDWYREQMPFSRPDQITLEKTPAYFITPQAPERIRKMNPDVKLLLILRDPVIRVVSDYTQILTSRRSQNLVCKSFKDLVIDPLTGGINLGYKAVQISVYHHHYRRWLDTFPQNQIHIVDGDKLIENPVAELAKVERFLGVKHALTEDHFYFNKTKGFYCMTRNSTSERCLGASKGRHHPDIDPKVLLKLRQFYVPHNDIFYNLTGRKFDWSEV